MSVTPRVWIILFYTLKIDQFQAYKNSYKKRHLNYQESRKEYSKKPYIRTCKFKNLEPQDSEILMGNNDHLNSFF